MIVVILGPPGSGKGTQAQRLSEKLNLAHISAGDILRKAIADRNDLGKRVKDIVESGRLVPDELVTEVVVNRLEGDNLRDNLILDGYPRTLGQARDLDSYLEKKGKCIDVAINLDTSNEEGEKRIRSRIVCSRCGENQSVTEESQKRTDECTKCGAPLLQREDDREEVIRERLKNYHNHTKTLLDYYKEKGILKQVNGEGDISEIFSRLLQVIEKQ